LSAVLSPYVSLATARSPAYSPPFEHQCTGAARQRCVALVGEFSAPI